MVDKTVRRQRGTVVRRKRAEQTSHLHPRNIPHFTVDFEFESTEHPDDDTRLPRTTLVFIQGAHSSGTLSDSGIGSQVAGNDLVTARQGRKRHFVNVWTMTTFTSEPASTEKLWDDSLIGLYQTEKDDLTRLARRWCDCPEIAGDLVHDAFVRLALAPNRLELTNEPAYLRSIVCNLARSFLRRRQVADRSMVEVARVSQPSQVAPEDIVVQLESDRFVSRSLSQLPERQRSAITLRYLDGLSEREAAARMQVSKGSVKTHASRGRRRLMTLISDTTPKQSAHNGRRVSASDRLSSISTVCPGSNKEAKAS